MPRFPEPVIAPMLGAALLTACGRVGASSHRETPFITTAPKVDATDFHRFRSYEPGCADDATVIANYVPLQGACGGPNASVRRRPAHRRRDEPDPARAAGDRARRARHRAARQRRARAAALMPG